MNTIYCIQYNTTKEIGNIIDTIFFLYKDNILTVIDNNIYTIDDL